MRLTKAETVCVERQTQLASSSKIDQSWLSVEEALDAFLPAAQDGAVVVHHLELSEAL